MNESRKRPESEDVCEISSKKSRTPAIHEEDEDFLSGFPPIEEETANEVMKLLEKEICYPVNLNPSSSAIFSSSSSSYITINGNEESCGPSFSDSASTVMASIDIGSIGISNLMGPTVESSGGSMSFSVTEDWFWPEVGEDMEEGLNGCEGVESDAEWLREVLGGTLF